MTCRPRQKPVLVGARLASSSAGGGTCPLDQATHVSQNGSLAPGGRNVHSSRRLRSPPSVDEGVVLGSRAGQLVACGNQSCVHVPGAMQSVQAMSSIRCCSSVSPFCACRMRRVLSCSIRSAPRGGPAAPETPSDHRRSQVLRGTACPRPPPLFRTIRSRRPGPVDSVLRPLVPAPQCSGGGPFKRGANSGETEGILPAAPCEAFRRPAHPRRPNSVLGELPPRECAHSALGACRLSGHVPGGSWSPCRAGELARRRALGRSRTDPGPKFPQSAPDVLRNRPQPRFTSCQSGRYARTNTSQARLRRVREGGRLAVMVVSFQRAGVE